MSKGMTFEQQIARLDMMVSAIYTSPIFAQLEQLVHQVQVAEKMRSRIAVHMQARQYAADRAVKKK